MAKAAFTQSSFLGGEWGQVAQGRIDRPDYRSAMNVCLNGFPTEQGAWVKRSGFLYAGYPRNAQKARVHPFHFQQSHPYDMEFTDNYIRFWDGTTAVTTNDNQTITSISAANPAVCTTATAHGWVTGQQIIFSGLGTNSALLQNRPFEIVVIDSTHFSLADPLLRDTGNNPAPINGATLGTFVGGAAKRILEIQTAYTSGAWAQIVAVQAEKNMILLHGQVAPQTLSVVTFPSEGQFATFELNQTIFTDGPYFDPVGKGVTVTPSGLTGSINLTLSSQAYSATTAYSEGDFVLSVGINYQSLQDNNLGHTPASSPTFWVAASPSLAIGPDGFTGLDIGRHVRLFSEPPLWTVGTVYATGNQVAYVDQNGNTAYYTCLAANTAALTNAPGVSLTSWGINANGALWSWGKITALATLISPSFTHIGNLTTNGGLAAAFDGEISQIGTQCARRQTGGAQTIQGFIGQNYGGTPQKIQSATLYGATDNGLARFFWVDNATPGYSNWFKLYTATVVLRAKNSAPATAGDGFALATTTLRPPFNSVNLISNDQTTAYQYVWFDITATSDALPDSINWFISQDEIYVGEAQFFAPQSAGGSSTVTMSLLGNPLLYTTPIRIWRLGLFCGTTSFPTAGCYHEGRLWLTGSLPNRFDGSVPLKFKQDGSVDAIDFAPTEANGTVTAANGIAYTLDGAQSNIIYWMQPDQQGIIMGTQTGEWLVQATTANQPLTPSTIQAHRVTKIGCANILPRRAEHTLLFVHKNRRKLMEYFADIFSGKFSAPDLAKDAKHLTAPYVSEIAYQQDVSPILWARCDDGSLIGMAYQRNSLMSSQGPSFAGWHRHTLGSSALVESICVGPTVDGNLDSLCAVVRDPNSTRRTIEVLGKQFEETDTIATASFLDRAIPVASTNYTVTGSTVKLYGLMPLAGQNADIYCNGLDLGTVAIAADGTVTLSFVSANPLFTAAFMADSPVFVVGFAYTARGQIVRPATQQETRAPNGPAIGKKRRAHKYAALFVNSQAVKVGTEFDKLNACNFTTAPDGGRALLETELKSGLHATTLTDDNGYDSMFCWQSTRPKPCCIAAVTTFLDTRDE